MWVLIFVIFEWLSIAVLSGYMIWYYARKNVEWYTKAFVYVAWFFGFSVIILLPYDVYISYIMKGDSQTTSENAMNFIWRMDYWIAFVF